MNSRYTRLTRLLGGLLVATMLAACGSAARPETAAQPEAASGSGPASQVGVTATDFAFALDAAQAKAGSVTFAVANEGQVPHDFEIRGNAVEQKTPVIDAGQSASLTVDLPAGTYNYRCAVPGHDLLGMKGTLTVAP